jgi:quercetin dioxygenase-like cupin family protein
VKKMFLTIALVALAAGTVAATTPKKAAHSAAKMPDHGLATPADLKWGPAPPAFQPGAELAVLEGSPMGAGPYVVRLKMPDGFKIMPHWHPTTENITVISGTFHLGTGGTFDETKGTELKAGSFGFVGPHMKHFAWATGETIVQVHGMGPFKLVYVNPADDPRKAAAK